MGADEKSVANGKAEKQNHNDEITDVNTLEGQAKKLKYPKSVAFIISNEFCERFNYYGLRTILVLYLSRELGYSDDSSTVIFHIFTMLVYFLCIFGAIIADSWLGKFKTIMYLSMVYVVGSVLVTLGAIPTLNLPGITFTMLGLSLIALGSGGIKPCVSAFGGDQFQLPEQLKQMATFFSLFYFSINAGSLISTTVTPILREDVHCFGQLDCYSLAFGVPAILMIVSIIIFVLGKPLYKSKPPAGNMFVTVSKTISCAITTKWKEKKTNPKDHWLDYAECKYDKQSIDDIKVLLRVLVLYIPLPVFWALFDQQGSRWTFQATRMDGDMGAIDIKPDQLQMLNPLLILIFIPLYDVAIYPLLSKIGIRRPLQKLTLGGILAGIAFIISALVEIELENTYPVLPSAGFSQLRVFNGVPNCEYAFVENQGNIPSFNIKGLELFEEKYVDVSKQNSFTFSVTSNDPNCLGMEQQVWSLASAEANSFYIFNNQGSLRTHSYIDKVDKPSRGSPLIRVLANFSSPHEIIWKEKGNNRYKHNSNFGNLVELPAGAYKILIDDNDKFSEELKQGGVYTYVIGEESPGNYVSKMHVIAEPNSMNIFWLVPQYVVMTLGEVMFSVTGLEFSYAQAPITMKSVLQACWLLTVAFGNVIVVIIAELKIFESQANEFFLFAGLMFVDMIFFMFLAYRYKPNNPLELLANSDADMNNQDDHKKIQPLDFKSTKEDVSLQSGPAKNDDLLSKEEPETFLKADLPIKATIDEPKPTENIVETNPPIKKQTETTPESKSNIIDTEKNDLPPVPDVPPPTETEEKQDNNKKTD